MGLDKAFADIAWGDLDDLVRDQVPEKRILEYKRELPSRSDDDRREFLADVSSFANTSGGLLIFGIEEREGLAYNICGLGESDDPNAEILRLEGMARTGIDPRLPSFETRAIKGPNDECVIIMRIDHSWASPHMVTYKNWSRFFARTSAGKYQLDVGEIRSRVLLSQAAGDRIRNFRLDRVAKVRADETSILLGSQPKAMLHVVPFGTNGVNDALLDAKDIRTAAAHLRSIRAGSTNTRFNLDGFLMYHSTGDPPDDQPTAYVQIFRDGSVEAVDTTLFRPASASDVGKIAITVLERGLIDATGSYLRFQTSLGVQPPFFVMATLIDVRHLEVPPTRGSEIQFEHHLIDRDVLLLPEIEIDDVNANISATLKPLIDAIWNAGDWAASPHYDQSGQWMGPLA